MGTDQLMEAISVALGHSGENHEVALHYLGGENPWFAEASNPSEHVSLGETRGRYAESGATAEEALKSVLAAIEEENSMGVKISARLKAE
jgi:hypothetical protein